MTYTKLHEGMQPIQLGGGGGGTLSPHIHYHYSILPSHHSIYDSLTFLFQQTLCCISIDTHIGMIHKDKEKAFLYTVMLSYAH
jgi:hypothetical protein